METSIAEQVNDLTRVTARIGAFVERFVLARLREQRTFTAHELRRFVMLCEPGIAPASPDRVLRALRQARRINYVVTNRRASEYKPLEIDSAQF
jgi:hypothetical protein